MITVAAADPFLRAVIADPDDDLPRLVYADALDAGDCPGVPRDPGRAEFIRLGCGSGADPLRQAARGIEWLDRHADDWFNYFGPAERPIDGWRLEYARSRDALWSRGFVCEITLPAADWLAHGDAILAACPVRRVWRVDGRHPDGHWSGDGLVRLTDLEGWRVETRPTDWHPTVAASITVSDGGAREVATFAVTRAELARRDGVLPSDRELIGRALAERWPGVEFELPASGRRPSPPDTDGPFHVQSPGAWRVPSVMARTAELTDDAE